MQVRHGRRWLESLRMKNLTTQERERRPWVVVVNNERGMALVLALVAIVLVAMLSLSGVVTSQGELQMAVNEQSAKRAFDVAEAGVRHAFRILGSNDADAWSNGFNDELSDGGTGGSLASAGGEVVTLEDNLQYRFFAFGGSGANDGYYIRAVDNFDDADQTTDVDQKILIVARGRVGTAEKVIEAISRPPVNCALTFGESPATIGGNSSTDNLQLNTSDGSGACVHGNGNVSINGNPSFPDGATASGTMSCVGNAQIGSGGCSEALGGQPPRTLTVADIGAMSQRVADLGNANVNGPYYILHTRNSAPGAGQWIVPAGGLVTKGGNCWETDPDAPNPGTPDNSRVGLCNGGVAVAMPAGVTIDTGTRTCTFTSSVQPGIYYCDGNVKNQGNLGFSGTQRALTIISRDHMTFGSQTNMWAFFNNVGAATVTALTNAIESSTNHVALSDIPHPLPYDSDQQALTTEKIKTNGKLALKELKNILYVSGADLTFSGNNDNLTGIILVHNELSMIGGKTVTGYLVVGDGLPTYPGDPHPAANVGQNVYPSKVNGNITINFMNFDTLLPLGAPRMVAWNDDAW
jgi:hypothetical protein